MTSKEAMAKLKENFEDEVYYWERKMLDIIDKDLAILELIKNNKIIFLRAIFNERNSYCGQSNVEVKRAKEYQEELNKIKEWLEK